MVHHLLSAGQSIFLGIYFLKFSEAAEKIALSHSL